MSDAMHLALMRKMEQMKGMKHDPLEGHPEEEVGESPELEKKELREGTDLAPSLDDALHGKSQHDGDAINDILKAIADGGGTPGHHKGGLHARAADGAKSKMASMMNKKGLK